MDRTIASSNAAERQRLEDVVKRLTDADFDRPLDPGWTVGAALVHVAFWDRRVSVLIDRWLRHGLSASEIDLDAVNEALLPQWRLIPPRATVDELLTAMEEMDRKVEALPAELTAEIVDRELAVLDRGQHRRAHREQIERALG